MIDMEKSKIEAEALAKLRKEQYFREVLAGELSVMIDQHFASKVPLREILQQTPEQQFQEMIRKTGGINGSNSASVLQDQRGGRDIRS